MFNNYLKIAFRNLKKHLGYSLLNVAGLALGMACCIFIYAWIVDEKGTDHFHDKIESLYRVRTTVHYGSETRTGGGSVPALGPALKAEFPEVLNSARFANGQSSYLLDYGGKQFREFIQLADPQIFEMFTFPFAQGNSRDAFSGPQVMVLSESLARRIFGTEDPVGKIVSVDKRDDFRVIGVMKNIPANSSVKFNIWVPLEITKKWWNPRAISTWYNMAFDTYVELAAGVDRETFNAKIFNRIRQSDPRTVLEPSLYPFKDVYLKLTGRNETIRIFSVIALFILIIACINFMNLTTARSARRAREVGLRKVIGAERRQIRRQFFGESLLSTLISLVLAGGFIAAALPGFRSLTGKPIYLAHFIHPSVLVGILAIAILTGVLAGSYPAVFLSGFRPVTVLKGVGDAGTRGRVFRTILVIVQFSMSALLIIGTAVIFSQVRFMKNKDLGFNRDHLLYVPLEGNLSKSIDSFKSEVMRSPLVQSASATSHSPTGIYSNGQGWNWEGRDPRVDPLVTYFGVDPDFLATFKMEMSRGETFQVGKTNMTDVIVNERFAQIIGRPDVVGMSLTSGARNLRILGVVKDFHFMPVDRTIIPILVFFDPTYRSFQTYRYLFIRLHPGNVSEAISFLQSTVQRLNPGFPFEYRFLDDDYDQLYRAYEREMDIVRTFAGLAIFISCLGLFGLAAYTAEQRTKEIGIRKVLGATIPGIVALLSREYAKWVLAANLLAWPFAYLFLKGWLKNFAYRIPLHIAFFIGAGLATVFLAQLTVGYQALKAARSNPANSIRYE
jgi:predicted permease